MPLNGVRYSGAMLSARLGALPPGSDSAASNNCYEKLLIFSPPSFRS
jgi:hypothetical protein